ncbi:MAG: bifunctional adenosylcobinamide kinase/adenosylcobinamide-phosphate guanylyltransferase [Campylobacterales bacterium]|nr:bifunctional adenosylcobinamide kinase/adenosylcobinamide-phosphate guanylyltransferase [Campylobacterales bacterium]
MGFQALFIGGIKSGKSKNAEAYTLKFAKQKPLYLATTEFFDDEMHERVQKHKDQRADKFETLEEALNLDNALQKQNKTVLVECVSMWINNMLYHNKTLEEMMTQLENISKQENNVIFVINDVSNSVISENQLVRKFVDINGIISQYIAEYSKEVFHVTAGISVKIK